MEAVLCTLGYLSGLSVPHRLALVLLGWHSHINAMLQDKWTALMKASIQGHNSVVKVLVDNKADPNAAHDHEVIPPYTHSITQHVSS